MADFPTFKYHPDPIKTGSVIESDMTCIVCEQKRGYIYVGPAYAVEEYSEEICPWCINDGSAHEKLDAEFCDSAGVGGYSADTVADNIIEEVAYRTPGFLGWQQEQWFTHCNDAAAFLGAVGYKELLEHGDDAIQAIRASTGLAEDDEWQEFFEILDKDGAPTAYLFRCLHCGAYGGYTDND